MLEAIVLATLAFWMIAAATHRFRRESGVTRAVERHALRGVGIVLLMASAACCGSPVFGEWSVRFLAAASIAGVGVVLALSAASVALFAPLRRVIVARR